MHDQGGEINALLGLGTEFSGKLTTTEFLCRHIFDKIAAAAASGALGEDGKGLAKIRVTLSETDLARAWYEGPVRA